MKRKLPSKTVNYDTKTPNKLLFVFNTSSANTFSSSKKSWRRLEDVLKTSCKYVLKTSWRRLEDISQDVLKTSWGYLKDVLEDKKLLRWRSLEYVLKTCLEDMSWRHVLKMSWRSLGDKQNVYWGYLYLTMAY